jgi:hypothetical protein
MDFKANLSRPQSNMVTTMTIEQKLYDYKSSTTMPMFYSSLKSCFNLFSIETNINRKKEAHHKLVLLWNH